MADTSHYAHCRTLMERCRRWHVRRIIAMAILLAMNFYFHALTFGVKYGGASFYGAGALEQKISMLPFGMGMATLLCSIAALVLAVFADVKRPKVLIGLMVLILLCAFADFIHWLLAGIILVVWGLQFKEVLNYRWLKEQPGFPHFSERLDEQTENSEYKPLHEMDGKRQGEMSEIAEGESDDFMRKAAEMPDIPDIPETETPEPLSDTSVILSDPMSDFPELPDIPELPKL